MDPDALRLLIAAFGGTVFVLYCFTSGGSLRGLPWGLKLARIGIAVVLFAVVERTLEHVVSGDGAPVGYGTYLLLVGLMVTCTGYILHALREHP